MDALILLGVTIGMIAAFGVCCAVATGYGTTIPALAAGAAIGLGIIGIAWLILVPGMYIASNDDVGELYAMRDSISAYDDAISAGQQLNVEGRENLHKAITDFAYAGSGAELITAVTSRRDLIKDYNSKLRSLQRRNHLFLLGLAVVNLPTELEPIR